MAYNIQDKGILVTGAASGIGKEAAILLAGLGAHVVLVDLNADQGREVLDLIREQGGHGHFIQANVASADDVSRMMKEAAELAGQIHCAINSAGIEHQNLPLADCSEALFDEVIDINLKGVFLCMRAQIQHMLSFGGGHIINLSSVAGVRAAPMLSPYAASKFGVVGLTKSAAVEYARANIRINAVCPSFINTPMVQRSLKQMSEKLAARLVHANPMHRLGEPEEIARCLAWLCSEESSFMTGQTVVLDGGMTA